MSKSRDAIRLFGVRVNNLRGLDVAVSLNQLTVVTGVSGSGKSSLAFDGLFAEGQRRYIEAFPVRARKLLPKIDRPNIDRVENIPPAIAVGQFETAGANTSTVAAAVGVQDLLQHLFASSASAVCPNCNTPVFRATASNVANSLIQSSPTESAIIGFDLAEPLDVDAVARWTRQGFVRCIIGDELCRIEESKNKSGNAVIVVDRVTLTDDDATRTRLVEAIETARRYSASAEAPAAIFMNGTWRRFSDRLSCPKCTAVIPTPTARFFSNALADSHCPACKGIGLTRRFDLGLAIPDPKRSLRMGALSLLAGDERKQQRAEFLKTAKSAGLDIDKEIDDFTAEERSILESGNADANFLGVNGLLQLLLQAGNRKDQSLLKKFESETLCEECKGSGYGPLVRAFRLADVDFPDWISAPANEAAIRAKQLLLDATAKSAGADRLVRRLESLEKVGIGYLQLNRPLGSLSTGEARRVALATALGARLAETLFVLDEPTSGLHPEDTQVLLAALRDLQSEGNTVVVVEHDLTVINSADAILELGPGAGAEGGNIVFEGTPEELVGAEDSLTAPFLDDLNRPWMGREIGKPSGWLLLKGASANNLKNIDVRLPLGVMTAIVGVSGAGKSSLVFECLEPAIARAKGIFDPKPLPLREIENHRWIDEVIAFKPEAGGRSNISNAATYLKFFDDIRKLFAETLDAQSSGLDVGAFSFNTGGGRCERCSGAGELSVEMHFLPSVTMTCPDCKGRRFRPEVLNVKLRGRNIAEVLELTVREAFGFFRTETKIQERLKALIDVGLGYMRLGQATSHYSGGELQRLKLASHLGVRSNRRTLFLFDEPTTGLHPADLDGLLECFGALLAVGHTIIVVEHNPHFLVWCDHLVELGPGAGAAGGNLISEGAPLEVSKKDTPTGRVLRPMFEDAPRRKSKRRR